MGKPLNEEQLVALGYDYLDARNFRMARRVANKLIKMDSDLGFCILISVFIEDEEKKDVDKLRRIVEEGRRRYPWSPDLKEWRTLICVDVAERCLELGQHLTALSVCRDLQRARSFHGYLIESRLHRENGDVKKALACMRKGYKVFPDLWLIGNELGTCLQDSGDLEEALSIFKTTLQLDDLKREPESIDTVRSGVVVTLNRLDRLDDALAMLNTVSKLEGSWLPMKMSILTRLGRFDEMIELGERWKRTIDVASDSWVVCSMHYYLACAYMDSGNLAKAKENADIAVGIEPENEFVQELLCEIASASEGDSATEVENASGVESAIEVENDSEVEFQPEVQR